MLRWFQQYGQFYHRSFLTTCTGIPGENMGLGFPSLYEITVSFKVAANTPGGDIFEPMVVETPMRSTRAASPVGDKRPFSR